MNTTKNKKSSPSAPPAKHVRPVDVYFDQYSKSHQSRVNKVIHWICVPLLVFSLLGLTWAIPFPYLKFMGQYAGFFNWASFLMAFAIYYYYKLSPILSYLMLLIIFAFSYGIMELDSWHKAGGPAPGLVCGIIFIVAWAGQFAGHKIEGKKPSFLQDLKFLLIGPIWLLHFLLKKFSIKY